MIDRMVRASQANVTVYEEVERDVNATGQAALVVLIVAIASGIGSIWFGGVRGLVGGIVSLFVGWILWSAITYWVGKNLFATSNTRVSLGEMLRTLGFALSPGVLLVVGLIPVLGWIATPLIWIWMVVLGVIAIRQAMDFDTGRAIATAVVGFIPFIIIYGILMAIVY